MGRPEPRLPILTPYDRQRIRREQKRERIHNKYSLRPLARYGLMCYAFGVFTAYVLIRIIG
jgi:hypothetical protein